MKKSRKLSIKAESEREVQQIEKMLNEQPESDKIQVTKEMDDALFAKIRELEERETQKEEQESREENKQENIEQIENKPTKIYKKKKRVHWYVVLAAVLVLVLAFGSVSMGSKSYWKELLDVIVGDESVKVINVEDMDKQSTEDVDEAKAYNEIGDVLGIVAVKLVYKPQGMKLVDYIIDQELGQAKLFYKYNEESIRYTIYANNEDSSLGSKEEDELIEQYTMKIQSNEIKVSVYKLPEHENREVASFEYKGVHYELKGSMEQQEFEKILKNLFFSKKA